MISPRFGRHIPFMRGVLALYLVFLVVFFAAAPFLTLWLYAETKLRLSLLPQLIGFCLQGAFLVVVIAIYEKRTAIRSMRSHKFALRSAVAAFIRPLASTKNYSGNDSLASSMALQHIHKRITEKKISESVMKQMEEDARMILVSFESLTVLAAQIDIEHLEAWRVILNHIRRIGTSQSQEEIEALLLEMLNAVQSFDDLYIY
ncbi:MAG: hypothetical protein HQL73_05785 [Magnetococcales bacterium]|nr:hypothetical protein [Magnetococcales bacterium]